MINPETDLFKKPSLDAGGKPENLEKNLWKQVWTEKRCWDWGLNPGSVVHSTGEELLHLLLPPDTTTNNENPCLGISIRGYQLKGYSEIL